MVFASLPGQPVPVLCNEGDNSRLSGHPALTSALRGRAAGPGPQGGAGRAGRPRRAGLGSACLGGGGQPSIKTPNKHGPAAGECLRTDRNAPARTLRPPHAASRGRPPPVPRVLPQPLHEPHGVAVPGHGAAAATAALPAPPLPLHKAPGQPCRVREGLRAGPAWPGRAKGRLRGSAASVTVG